MKSTTLLRLYKKLKVLFFFYHIDRKYDINNSFYLFNSLDFKAYVNNLDLDIHKYHLDRAIDLNNVCNFSINCCDDYKYTKTSNIVCIKDNPFKWQLMIKIYYIHYIYKLTISIYSILFSQNLESKESIIKNYSEKLHYLVWNNSLNVTLLDNKNFKHFWKNLLEIEDKKIRLKTILKESYAEPRYTKLAKNYKNSCWLSSYELYENYLFQFLFFKKQRFSFINNDKYKLWVNIYHEIERQERDIIELKKHRTDIFVNYILKYKRDLRNKKRN